MVTQLFVHSAAQTIAKARVAAPIVSGGAMMFQKGFLNFSLREDPRKRIDRLEKQMKQRQTTTKHNIDDDTRTDVLQRAQRIAREVG